MMAEMTVAQFEVVAEMLRSRDPAKAAARMVLVDGLSARETTERMGLKSQQIATNAVRRYRNAHKKIQIAYVFA